MADTIDSQLRQAIKSNDIIYIHGPPSVGKTYFIKQTLSNTPGYVYTYINCNNVTTPSQLYVDIARSLSKHLGSRAKDLGNYRDKLMGIIELRSLIARYCELMPLVKFTGDKKKISGQTAIQKLFIVFDQVELLRRTSMIDTLIPLFCLRADFKYAIGIILISCETICDFLNYLKNPNMKVRILDDSTVINLNYWSKEQTVAMILEQHPKKFGHLYERFVHNVVEVVYDVNTKDFRELRSFCQEKFENFLSRCKRKIYDRHKENDPNSPDFEEFNLDNCDLSDEKILNAIMSSFLTSFKSILHRKDVRSWNQSDTDRKVVINTSILIVAVYVAAFTSATDDKRNFVRYQRRQSKRMRTEQCDKKSKPFTLERLLHIYYSLSKLSRGTANEEEVKATDLLDSVLSDIQLLEDLDIIHIVTGDGLDSLTRYKMSHSVSKKFVEILAKQTDTPLTDIFGLVHVV